MILKKLSCKPLLNPANHELPSCPEKKRRNDSNRNTGSSEVTAQNIVDLFRVAMKVRQKEIHAGHYRMIPPKANNTDEVTNCNAHVTEFSENKRSRGGSIDRSCEIDHLKCAERDIEHHAHIKKYLQYVPPNFLILIHC
ncbi:hypothetical protein RhiirA5_378250 [Rhizophagus irregularis]|uniref:Uncharacterized protein n=1 Tax=Rhizophagus irregularis TaxID=588596 RepID=A0A2N0PGG5_9GLOM|nr:hypothetical protein RhiirA5_378250 [Rhizophagus irregularis]